MLEKIPGMNISDEAKKHWEGVARYFRAMAYSTPVSYTHLAAASKSLST